jgi:hypothetical protein
MQPVTVLFAPAVDAALVELIDHVDVDRIATVLDFLERIQGRFVQTLSTVPEAGPFFQGGADVPGGGVCISLRAPSVQGGSPCPRHDRPGPDLVEIKIHEI